MKHFVRNRFSQLLASTTLVFLAIAAAGCGPVVELPPRPSEPVTLLSCFNDVRPKQLPASQPGAYCGGPGTLGGFTQFALVGFQVVGLPDNGPISVRHEFFPDINKELKIRRSALLSRGEYVAAALVTSAVDASQGDPAKLTVVILERNGALLQEFEMDVTYQNWGNSLNIVGDHRGIFAVGYRFGDDIGTEVFTMAGFRSGKLDGYLPLTNPDERGYLAVQNDRDSPNRPVYWLDPCTLERKAAKRNDVSFGGSMQLRSELAYLDAITNEVVLEGERDERRTKVGPNPAYSIDAHPQGYMVFATSDPAKLVVVHPRTGSKKEFTITLPAGLRRYDTIPGPGFDGAAREIHVTAQGGLSLPLRDDTRGRLYVTENGSDWKAVGLPIGKVYRAYSADAGGNYLHFGSDFAVSLPPWNPPAAGENRIDGMSLQFAREDGESMGLLASNSRWYHLTNDGGCVAYAQGNTIVRANHSQKTMHTFQVTDDPNWHINGIFTWVDGDDVMFLAQ